MKCVKPTTPNGLQLIALSRRSIRVDNGLQLVQSGLNRQQEQAAPAAALLLRLQPTPRTRSFFVFVLRNLSEQKHKPDKTAQ